MKKAVLTFVTLLSIFLLTKIIFFKSDKISGKKISNVKSQMDDMERAMRQEFEMTKDPVLGYIPNERLLIAQQVTERAFRTQSPSQIQDILTWIERGPDNISGRTRTLFIDVRDATGNTVFAGGVSGGIWKATNFKTNPIWTKINDNLANLAICALIQDPTNPNIMYAGTGEGWYNSDAIRGNGIFKSVDGGNTWNQLPNTDVNVTKDFEYVNDLAITNNGILFAACRSGTYCNRGGILRSTDGGNTWTTVIGSFSNGANTCDSAKNYRGADLEIAANGDLYVTTGFNSAAPNNTGRIWKSSVTNGNNIGAINKWIDVTPAPPIGQTWARIDLACAPNNPQKLVALIGGNDNAIKSIQVSETGGLNWNPVPIPRWCDQGVIKTDFTRGQSWFDLITAIDPNNPNSFLIGGIDVLQTKDNGNSFNQITQWTAGCTGSIVHADIHNIVYYPGNSNEIILATDGGVYYSADGGTTFENKSTNFNITQFYSVTLHPTAASNFMLAGAQDNGTQRFNSNGSKTVNRILAGDGGFCFIDQLNPQIQIGSYTDANYLVSRDGGNSFLLDMSNGSGRFINPADYDAVSKTLYHASDEGTLGLIKNIDAGDLAPAQVTLPELNNLKISAIKVDPNVVKRVWVAASGPDEPVLLRVDHPDEFNQSVTTITSPLFPSDAYLASIDVEKNNDNHLLITFSNYGVTSVFESTNGGASWRSIEGNLPDMPIRWGMFLPSSASTGKIALATELGVWTTAQINGEATVWVPNNLGLANVSVRMLQYRSSDNTLAAATFGRGIFTTSIDISGQPIIESDFITKVYPTIASNDIDIVPGKIAGVNNIIIQLYDTKGSKLMEKKLPYQSKKLSIMSLPKGMYILKIISDDSKYKYVQKIIKG